jgi:5-methyltetrahydrofolate--homocysteine methyltransferase
MVFKDLDKQIPLTTVHFLRQQGKKAKGLPNVCLADFIAPENSGVQDFLGFFAGTAGLGIESLLEQFKMQHVD